MVLNKYTWHNISILILDKCTNFFHNVYILIYKKKKDYIKIHISYLTERPVFECEA